MSQPNPSKGSLGRGLAAGGVVAFGVACCAGGPLLLGLVASIAAGGALGVGAGTLLAASVLAVVVWRLRRRRACRVDPLPPAAGPSPSARPAHAQPDHPPVEVTR